MSDERRVEKSSADLIAQHASLSPSVAVRTIWDTLIAATERLEASRVTESPQLDAELLLRHVLGIDRAQLFMRYDDLFGRDQYGRFDALVERRLAGEPIAYILQQRWFRTIDLYVDERVLIPRPETERFVDYALGWLKAHPGPRRVIDVGTGSGAIALALATELPRNRRDVHIVGIDISRSALEVAAFNRERLGLQDRVDLAASDLLAAFSDPFDLILANLPYLRPGQEHPSTRLEPDVALFAGVDGFALHRSLLRHAAELLALDGLYVGEIDPSQGALGVEVARELTGRPARVDKDLAGLERYLLVGDLPAS